MEGHGWRMGQALATARVFDEAAPIVARTQVSADTFELSFRAPRIAAAARPGQFVNVLLPSPDYGYRILDGEQGWRPARSFLLRRPFSIYRRHAAAGAANGAEALAVLVKVVGDGTRRLVELPEGSMVKLLGPLGNSFRPPPAGGAAALVAGGCGWASLGLLARDLRGNGHPTYAFIGAQSVETLPVRTTPASTRGASFLDALPGVCLTSAELEALGVVVALAAESGGKVYGGFVTDLLAAFLRKKAPANTHIYACGPWAMLRRVAELAREHRAPCQVAMEEHMACGMGVCNSCVVSVVLPDGSPGHKKLCVDGPVLDAEEVAWSEQPG